MQKRRTFTRRPLRDELIGKIFFSERRITIESDAESYYVHPPRARGFIHGDMVAFTKSRIAKDGKMAEAKPERLVKRSTEEVIIEAHQTKKWTKWSLLPVFGTLAIEVDGNPRVQDGDLFIVRFQSGRKLEILRKFGNINDRNILEELIFFQAGTRREWPSDVEKYTPERPVIEKVPIARSSFWTSVLSQSISLKDVLFPKVRVNNRERLDFRSWYTMTIDGADAKDLDDAISIAKYEGGDTLLGVHIADVAEYVNEHTPLDREAYLRGTSIYTPGRVIPMLPESLSNDLCSLHPGEPKLALSLLMRIDSKGFVKESFVTEGLIESSHRGVYEEIFSVQSVPTMIIEDFQTLYHILRERRKKEGKIIFETTECYFDLDNERNVTNMRKRERWDAHMMIEEFMVLANEEVAKWCAKRKIPFLSRVHEVPSDEKTREIHEVIAANVRPGSLLIGFPWNDGDIEPHHIRSILEQAKSDDELYRFSRLLLPKMTKAVYREKPIRHFGLALTHYAHFTSPIRRYPDLLIHRMVKKYLHKETSSKRDYEKNMKKWGESLSQKERSAEDVSRAIDDLFMCRYMEDKVGQVFAGMISGVTESNIYVELENGVEGSIYLKNISERFTLDSARGSLRDRKGEERYRIWDQLSVKVLSVDVKARRVEMEEA
jgi:ribonuclease R